MGISIVVHMEYRKRGKKQYLYAGRFQADRYYVLFSLMAGYPSYAQPLYPARGIPGNVTKCVLEEYQSWKNGGVAKYASWLTTDELEECVVEAHRLCGDETDDIWPESYKEIFSYMKDYENAGEPCRIVFWFDQ